MYEQLILLELLIQFVAEYAHHNLHMQIRVRAVSYTHLRAHET